MKKVAYVSLALGLVLVFACAKKPGTIEGKATLDNAATGNAGITVSVTGVALTAATDDSGAYSISGVPAGQYDVEAKKEGYDSKPLVGIMVENGKTLTGQNINLTKIVPPAPITPPVVPAVPVVPKDVVNINTANVHQLCLLPGINQKLAKAIIAKRKKADFGSAEDLLAVKGITKKELAKIQDLVVVEGETTMKPAKKDAAKKKAVHKASKKKAAQKKATHKKGAAPK
ncbi:MAG: DUF655 domain-containing protein [bacterium]|nr:DUF655 domain-containing protein [bacterium]